MGDFMDDNSAFGLGPDFRVSDGLGGLDGRRGDGSATRPPAPAKDASATPTPQTKAKSSLGKQLGRFGGAVSGRVKRGH